MIFIFEGFLQSDESRSILRENTFAKFLGSHCEVKKVRIPNCFTPEALRLGLKPDEVLMTEGPLVIAGLGFDPPESAMQFHLSLFSLTENVHLAPKPPTTEEAKEIRLVIERLRGKDLTPIFGEELVHGLVWERKGEHHTFHPNEIEKRGWKDSLPLGDAETQLRMLIDDSVNLLNEAEFNQRRVDQGELPLNVLWPWGQGQRSRISSLALRYGYPVSTLTDSIRFVGFGRIAGLKPERLRTSPMRTPWATMRQKDIIHTAAFQKLFAKDLIEEAHWLWNECTSLLLKPTLDDALEHQKSIVILCLGDETGLMAHFNRKSTASHFPFDERTLFESKAPLVDLDQVVRSELASAS